MAKTLKISGMNTQFDLCPVSQKLGPKIKKRYYLEKKIFPSSMRFVVISYFISSQPVCKGFLDLAMADRHMRCLPAHLFKLIHHKEMY
jgi:hypothetical protein